MRKLTVVESGTPTGLERLVADFLVNLKAKGNRPKTIEAYEYPLRRLLLPFCAREGVLAPEELNSRLLDRLAVEIQERGLSPHSVSSYVRHLRIFLRWAAAEGELPAKVNMEAVKAPRRDLRGLTLTEEEARAMADQAGNFRDELLVNLLFYTGLRLGEVRLLKEGDLLDLPHGGWALKVRGKTGERVVPLPPRIHRMLVTWLRKRPRTAGAWIFPTRRRDVAGEYQPVSARTVQTVVANAAEAAGVKKRVHPHLFRHSFATWALNRGMNPVTLQKILGHGSMEMISAWYAHQSDDDNYAAMLKLLTNSSPN